MITFTGNSRKGKITGKKAAPWLPCGKGGGRRWIAGAQDKPWWVDVAVLCCDCSGGCMLVYNYQNSSKFSE